MTDVRKSDACVREFYQSYDDDAFPEHISKTTEANVKVLESCLADDAVLRRELLAESKIAVRKMKRNFFFESKPDDPDNQEELQQVSQLANGALGATAQGGDATNCMRGLERPAGDHTGEVMENAYHNMRVARLCNPQNPTQYYSGYQSMAEAALQKSLSGEQLEQASQALKIIFTDTTGPEHIALNRCLAARYKPYDGLDAPRDFVRAKRSNRTAINSCVSGKSKQEARRNEAVNTAAKIATSGRIARFLAGTPDEIDTEEGSSFGFWDVIGWGLKVTIGGPATLTCLVGVAPVIRGATGEWDTPLKICTFWW